MAMPSRVKANGRYRLPPLLFEVKFLHLKASPSSFKVKFMHLRESYKNGNHLLFVEKNRLITKNGMLLPEKRHFSPRKTTFCKRGRKTEIIPIKGTSPI